jgi:hypothetical protein
MGLYLLRVAGLRYHRRQYRRAVATIQTDVAHRARNEFYHLRHYPRSEGIVLPTLFGNIRRSAEHYAFYMFGLDPITTWIRLIAVIPAEYAERIAEAESSAAFFINCSAVGILMALGCTYFALALATYRFAGLSLSILAVAGAYGSYRLACRAASDYGEYLRSAFDLYRFDLLRRLAIERPESQPWTLEVERTIWQRVQEVMFWADPESAVSFRPDPAPATASRGPISE